MAKIDWTVGFLRQMDERIGYASMEFGKFTANRWAEEIAAIEQRLKAYPTSYPPEGLLHGKKELYRRCHMMHRRFKLIYYYDEAEDTVHLVDIWDSKMDPRTLIRRIK